MERTVGELNPPARLLLGPGPSNVHPRVYRAMAAPVVGHLDPAFIAIMDDVVALLRTVLQTGNRMTLPISGTGSAGMEAAVVNLVAPGDTVIVGINGLFGERIADTAARAGATVVPVAAAWGSPIAPDDLAAALRAHPGARLVAIVHAETSTGVQQPMDDIARIVRDSGALLLVDAVTSLGGVAVPSDQWGADAVYSCTQKCLAAPPGLSPFTLSDRAVAVLKGRATRVQSWYLDLSMLESYWGSGAAARTYHHTAPITMIYALREALRVVVEEGLEARWQRHLKHGRALQAGLEAMGLTLHAPEGCRLPVLTTVRIPDSVDDAAVRRQLLDQYNLEIGGGLGPLRGKVWRIGLMGYGSSAENVLYALASLADVLAKQGQRVSGRDALSAALATLAAE